MKKVLLFSMVLLIISFSQAVVVWEEDMSSLAGWGEGSNAANEPGETTGGIRAMTYDVTLVQLNSWWDGAGWTGMWKNTGVVIKDNTDYVLTLRMVSWADEPAGVGKPVYVNFQNASTDPWTLIYEDHVMPTFNEWSDVSISFSTVGGANADAVGGQIAINITPDWWNNVGIDSITLTEVPEPATLVLLGLGSLLSLRKRR